MVPYARGLIACSLVMSRAFSALGGLSVLPPRVGLSMEDVTRPSSAFQKNVAPLFSQAFPPTNESRHCDGDGRFEAGYGHDNDDSSDNDDLDPPGWRRRGRLGGQDSRALLSSSGREGDEHPVAALPSAARPWAASPQSSKGRRKISPARPHSAAGVPGSRSGGGVQLAGSGKTWSREISERTTPPRPTSAPGRGGAQRAEGRGSLLPAAK